MGAKKKYDKKIIFLAGSIIDKELLNLSAEDKKIVDVSFSIQREFLPLEIAMNKTVAKSNLEETIEQIFRVLEFYNG